MLTLSSGFLIADKGDLGILAAMSAGDIDRDQLTHYPLRDGGHHRIDIVQPVIEQVKSAFEIFYLSPLGLYQFFVFF